jgi:2-oxoisovalerate dehydrogenase E2 component (dihydrolipoyl transacylase)
VPSLKQFKLPDVGEGLTEAEILTWHVHPGDEVTINQTVVEIETAKSAVELPSPYAGVVTELLADEGVTVDVGAAIITIDTDPTGAAETEPVPAPPVPAPTVPAPGLREDMVPPIPVPPEDAAVEPGLIGGPAPGGRTSVLVGYGPRTVEARRRPRKGQTGAADGAVPSPPGGAVAVLAKPPVRKLAKDLGVDLATVMATGTAGTITREDVERAAEAVTPPGLPAVARASGSEERIPVKGVRKMTAQAMVASAFTAPHVTEWVSVDVTRSMRLVKRLKAHRDFADVRVSPLLLVAKALLLGVRRHPGVNASWDDAGPEIVVRRDVNLGIAAATPRGLIVPNIKGAQDLPLPELARAIGELVTLARTGKTPPQDMAGGTITITNVGVFGVDSGTPILNPGEAAILAFGQVRRLPWVHKGKVRPRLVTQLALSFDHRIVDGELGSLFLADTAAVLEDPAVALGLI